MTKKPSDLKQSNLVTHLQTVKKEVERDAVLTSCDEVLKAYEYFQDADVDHEHLVGLTAIAIDNLWEE